LIYFLILQHLPLQHGKDPHNPHQQQQEDLIFVPDLLLEKKY
jgi:hypothetical protein